jgi:uncharacterized repeat protein (TIGR01451 family)
VTLRIPAGLSTGLSSCVPDGDGLACTVGPGTLPPLAGGALLVDLVPFAAGDYTVTASVTADQPDQFPESNVDSVAFTVTPAADAAVAMAESADPSPAGRPLTYTMTITNRGPSPASGVTLVDEWLAAVSGGVELVAVAASQGSCAVTAPGRFGCDLGTLAPGAAATVTLQLRPHGVGTLANRAEATGAEHDVDLTNNVASESNAIG